MASSPPSVSPPPTSTERELTSASDDHQAGHVASRPGPSGSSAGAGAGLGPGSGSGSGASSGAGDVRAGSERAGHPTHAQAQPSVKKACDNCRLRKTRCNLASPCTNCASRGFECTYATPHRKRGPAGRRLNEIREREQQRTKGSESSASPPVHGLPVAVDSDATPGQTRLHHQDREQQQPQQFVFVRNDNGPGIAAEKPMDPSASWAGYIHTIDTTSPALEQPTGPTSPSVGRTASTTTNSGVFDEGLFSVSNISNHNSLYPDMSVPGAPYNLSPMSRPSPPTARSNDLWPAVVTDESLIRWLDIYFDRLYPTLPILKRASVFARLMDREHHRNPDFGAMLLSLSAFALIQPVRLSEQKLSAHSRDQMINMLLSETVKMRTVVEFGQTPTLDMIFTSVFLFACLFQKEQHNAAWLRLREAVELGALFGLDKFESYVNCGPEQKQQRLRVYYLLAVTERAYGIQRHHSVGFLGHPSLNTRGLLESISSPADSMDLAGIVIHDDVESTCLHGLLQLTRLFDAIDEDFLRCWNSQCRNDLGGCRFLDEQTAIRIYNQINSYRPAVTSTLHGRSQPTAPPTQGFSIHPGPSEPLSREEQLRRPAVPVWLSSAKLTPSQESDILINQQWLQNRLWHLCLSHKLLIPQSEHRVLCISHAITIAEDTLQLCQQMTLASIETHGIGMIEKVYTIVESAIAAIRHLETAEWDSEDLSSTAGPSPVGGDIDSMSESGVQTPNQGHMRHHKPLLSGYLTLFKTIRAGEHVFLARYNTLVGPDLEG